VPDRARQIFAFSGVRPHDTAGRPSLALIQHAMSLAQPKSRLRVCYVPTATGDAQAGVDQYTRVFGGMRDVEFSALKLFTQPSVPDVRGHLLAQDVLFVEGGSVVNLMAVWRAHGLREIMRECWETGVVLSGASAGSICWYLSGTTDSFRDDLDPFTDGIGLLPYSNGVHDDVDDQPRRETYRRMIADGTLDPGYASEDGVGLHYVDTDLLEAVTIRPGKAAWRVDRTDGGGYTEERIEPRLI